jgi:hypothetical protein
MNAQFVSFVQKVTALSPGLGAAHQETLNYWAPDSPPLTVALGELGRRVVDDFNSVDFATNDAVFNAIEDAFANGDWELSTAVATGMIEAIVGQAIRIGIWDEVLPMFGKLSASHAIAWASP